MTIESGYSDRGGAIDIGRVMSRTFSVIARNPAIFILSAFLLGGIPAGLTSAAQLLVTEGAGDVTWQMVTTVGAIGWLAYIVAATLLQAVLVRIAIAGLGGGSLSLGEAFRSSISLILPLIGLSIMTALGIGLGFLLLFVPGVMLACAWAVAVPALVEERGGVFEAMGRSRALTRGSRWYVFLLFAIYLIAASMLGGFSGGLSQFGIALPVTLTLDVITSTATSMVAAAGVASLYVELRTVREGASFDALAEVFG